MERRIEYRMKPEDEKEFKIILDVLKKKLHFTVRQIRTSKYLPDGILKNGLRVTVRSPVVQGDLISVLLEEETPPSALPVQDVEGLHIPVDILLEDEDIVVLNKPAGIPVHPSHGHYADTMANALCVHYKKMGLTLVPRAVGRLDKDTTGAILFAKNRTAASRLSRPGAVEKTYLALAAGLVPEDTFTISKPLLKEKEQLNRMIVSELGKPAVTHGTVIRRFGGEESRAYSLIRLKLETGRTHQIRVHMASEGFPLIDDPIYNPETVRALSACNPGAGPEPTAFNSGSECEPSVCNPGTEREPTASRSPHALLHCESICFVHPFTMESVSVRAPLPDDFRRYLS